MVVLGHDSVRPSSQIYLIEIESDICSIVVTADCVILMILVCTANYRDQMAWLVPWGWASLGFQILSLLSSLSYIVEIMFMVCCSIIWLLTQGHCKIVRHHICSLPHAFIPQACFTPTFFPRANWITATTWLHLVFLTHRWFDLPIKGVELIWNVMVHLIFHHVLTYDLSTSRVLLGLRTGD